MLPLSDGLPARRFPIVNVSLIAADFAGGFVAMLTQTGMTLLFGMAADAQVPELGASGAIGGHPSRVATTLITSPSSTAPNK